MRRRPAAVPVVAAFLFAAAAMAAVTGASLLFPGTFLDRLWELNRPAAESFRSVGRISGAALWALGAATALAGAGLLRGRRWAWWFAMALFAVDICGDVVSFLITGGAWRSASGIAIAAAFLIALGRPRVRRFFPETRRCP